MSDIPVKRPLPFISINQSGEAAKAAALTDVSIGGDLSVCHGSTPAEYSRIMSLAGDGDAPQPVQRENERLFSAFKCQDHYVSVERTPNGYEYILKWRGALASKSSTILTAFNDKEPSKISGNFLIFSLGDKKVSFKRHDNFDSLELASDDKNPVARRALVVAIDRFKDNWDQKQMMNVEASGILFKISNPDENVQYWTVDELGDSKALYVIDIVTPCGLESNKDACIPREKAEKAVEVDNKKPSADKALLDVCPGKNPTITTGDRVGALSANIARAVAGADVVPESSGDVIFVVPNSKVAAARVMRSVNQTAEKMKEKSINARMGVTFFSNDVRTLVYPEDVDADLVVTIIEKLAGLNSKDASNEEQGAITCTSYLDEIQKTASGSVYGVDVGEAVASALKYMCRGVACMYHKVPDEDERTVVVLTPRKTDRLDMEMRDAKKAGVKFIVEEFPCEMETVPLKKIARARIAEARGDFAGLKIMAGQKDDINTVFEAGKVLVEHNMKEGFEAMYNVAAFGKEPQLRLEAAKALYVSGDSRGRDLLVAIINGNVDPLQSLGAAVLLFNKGDPEAKELLSELAMKNAGTQVGLVMAKLLIKLNDLPAAKRALEEGVKKAGLDAFIWKMELDKLR